ncbi:MAG: ATP-binding protein [Jatrophihabitans sp.]
METANVTPQPETTTPETVQLSVPAHPAYLGLVRTATAGVGARLDLTIDEIEDLRLAADEAGSLVLAHAVEGSNLDVRFTLAAERLTIGFSARTTSTTPPDEQSFGWTVLAALAGEVRADLSDGRLLIELGHVRAARSA